MTEEQVRCLLTLSNIPFSKIWKIENRYWPENDAYADVRKKSPWWLVRTPHGLIEIGWRKHVMQINWEDTPARTIVTQDDVTKEDYLVHAWSYPKAIEYLSVLSRELDRILPRS